MSMMRVATKPTSQMIDRQGAGAFHRDAFPDGKKFTTTASGEEPVKRGFYIEAPALLSFKLPAGARLWVRGVIRDEPGEEGQDHRR